MKFRNMMFLMCLLCGLTLTINAEEAAAAASAVNADVVSAAMSFLPAAWREYLGGILMLIGALRVGMKIFVSALHKFFEMTETKADDEFLAAIENSAALRTVLFWVDLICSWKPYRGPAMPAAANPTPATAAPLTGGVSLAPAAGLAVIALGICLCGTGCTGGAAMIRAAGKDPSPATLQIRTIYGTVVYSRAGASTNMVEISDTGSIKQNPH